MLQPLSSQHELHQVATLLGRSGLTFEPDADDVLGIKDQRGHLLATGSRQGALLKMIAVDSDHQSSELFAELIHGLIGRGYQAGIENFFVYTKPAQYHSFVALNFHLLCTSERVSLLEYGRGIKHYLQQYASLVEDGDNGCVVVNCNPFTLGHRYLIEKAAAKVDKLYVFVVEADHSRFPFQVRFDLVQKGVAHLRNVVVLATGPYAVSQVTFPEYFLKNSDLVRDEQVAIDIELFGRYIAPFFSIKYRFVGSEPYCAITHSYNKALRQQLGQYGVELCELARIESNQGAISASQVRKLLARNSFETLAQLVPETTLSFITSSKYLQQVHIEPDLGRH